ncbi:hypothetical protein [Pararhodobacter sp. CCB-MM2]|uniref:hypothetical protein n=1 Tax=Pararhodobacter sp. CCB-MM2 TaxID=1786003 RepID=UPI00082AE3EA|nr:hypothetical protein [Pararhodobacter sp. CCB-MM2]MCA2014437.1 hypothetical protein [Cereibacter sphaeroides]
MTGMDTEWIINVLRDLQDFADENGLTASATALDAAGIVITQELQKRRVEAWALSGAEGAPRAGQGAPAATDWPRNWDELNRSPDFTVIPKAERLRTPRPADPAARPARFRRNDVRSEHPTGAIGANGATPPVRLITSNGVTLS